MNCKHYKFLEKIPTNFKKYNDKTYIAIVGARSINDYNYIKKIFLKIVEDNKLSIKNIIIVSGGAKGVDSLAAKVAKEYNIPLIEIKPNWNKYGKKAGMLRNSEILKLSDLIIAIPGPDSKGTWDMVNKAKKNKKTMFIFNY